MSEHGTCEACNETDEDLTYCVWCDRYLCARCWEDPSKDICHECQVAAADAAGKDGGK